MALKTLSGFGYNPILESKINALKFDFVAMGHVHKSNFNQNTNIIYPGSTISFGFDELGEHGMVTGEINKHNLKLDFVKLDDRIFTKSELSVDNFSNKEELIEAISNLKFDQNTMYEIVLVGNRNFQINTREILKLIDNDNILKVKDQTEISYDIEEIAKENNLRGIFVRELIKKYQDGNYTEDQIKRAIEIGLSVM